MALRDNQDTSAYGGWTPSGSTSRGGGNSGPGSGGKTAGSESRGGGNTQGGRTGGNESRGGGNTGPGKTGGSESRSGLFDTGNWGYDGQIGGNENRDGNFGSGNVNREGNKSPGESIAERLGIAFRDLVGLTTNKSPAQTVAQKNVVASLLAWDDIPALTNYIKSAALARNIDPITAVKVAKSEGLGKGIWQSNFTKGKYREPSFGPFQLLMGGKGTGFGKGLGNAFFEKTGLLPSDKSGVQQQIDFALDYAAKNGWGSWYGAGRVGVSNWEGLNGAKAIGLSAPGTITKNDNSRAGDTMRDQPSGGIALRDNQDSFMYGYWQQPAKPNYIEGETTTSKVSRPETIGGAIMDTIAAVISGASGKTVTANGITIMPPTNKFSASSFGFLDPCEEQPWLPECRKPRYLSNAGNASATNLNETAPVYAANAGNASASPNSGVDAMTTGSVKKVLPNSAGVDSGQGLSSGLSSDFTSTIASLSRGDVTGALESMGGGLWDFSIGGALSNLFGFSEPKTDLGKDVLDAGTGAGETVAGMFQEYFLRGVVIILGLIFVAVGLALFKSVQEPVKQIVKAVK